MTEQTRNPNLDRTPAGDATQRPPVIDDWWTGQPPTVNCCPGVDADGRIHALPFPSLKNCTRAEVQAYFDNGWTTTEVLFSALSEESDFLLAPYHNLRHPFIFYYVHPVVLYINKLLLAGILEAPINPHFEALFETGVDEMSWDDLAKNRMEWPSLQDARSYRQKAYEAVSTVIATHPGLASAHEPITMDSPLWGLFLGFEHERIHIETSSVLMREFPLNRLRRPPEWPQDAPRNSPHRDHSSEATVTPFGNHRWLTVYSGQVVVGKDKNEPVFGWDNEYGHSHRTIETFEVTHTLISNGDFLEFVRDGGYSRKEYWSESGWGWRTYRNVKWPTFWIPDGPQGSHQYNLRTIFSSHPLPLEWPAVVNFHEAKAYAAWISENSGKDCRLLSEGEHHRLRQKFKQAPTNTNLRWGSEGPVTMWMQGEVSDIFGNLWQWCEDHFHPLPGFAVHPLYEDFSTPCFAGEHQMILGGSFISTGTETSPWARFQFRPHFFQHAGFRLAAGGRPSAVHITKPPAPAQTDLERLENQLFNRSSWPHQLAEISAPGQGDCIVTWITEKIRPTTQATLCHVGCGTGRLTQSLVNHFSQIEACDHNATAIARATANVSASTCNFRQADPCCLPADWADFDVVMVDGSGLLGDLPSPRALLGRLGGARGLVKKGGWLIMVSDFAARQTIPVPTPESPADLLAELGVDFSLVDSQEVINPVMVTERQYRVDSLWIGLFRRRSPQ